MKRINIKTIFLITSTIICNIIAWAQGRYISGDFHQHTTYTDGRFSFGYMMQKNNEFGLDWWANSEHGGSFSICGRLSGSDIGVTNKWSDMGITPAGRTNGESMWRWESLANWSFEDILNSRKKFPNKVIIQGFELNVPGHEHASMTIITNQFETTNSNADILAQFEYLFDKNDTDNSQPLGITQIKNTAKNHGKAVEALTWLQENYSKQSWVVAGHPERYKYSNDGTNATGWNIEHFRDLNNAAPDVFFGFESIPGHQAATNRCGYSTDSYGATTYGGAGLMCAKVGGLWDAMLSEGRNFWLFANSDCHGSSADFYPGEYLKNYTYVTEMNKPQAIVDGLRSGNTYVVMGDLIDSLYFSIGTASMGETFQTEKQEININIRLRDPQTDNHNTYGGTKNPILDHIDLIAGSVNHKIAPPTHAPADGVAGYSEEYKKDFVETTKVVARFGRTNTTTDTNGIKTTAWSESEDGFININYTYDMKSESGMYFRLRGTNQPLNTINETDANGNPLADNLMGTNSAEKAFVDLWFYSNPIFVSKKTDTKTEHITDEYKIEVYPNPANNYVHISGNNITDISIHNACGNIVKTASLNTQKIDISNLPQGIYFVSIRTTNSTTIVRKIVKQ